MANESMTSEPESRSASRAAELTAGGGDPPPPLPHESTGQPGALAEDSGSQGNDHHNGEDGGARKNYWGWVHTLVLVVIAAAMVLVGLFSGALVGDDGTDMTRGWLVTMLLMTLFIGIAGHGISGRMLGVLIDERNRMSLSRFQLIVWTVVVLSAFLTVALGRIAVGGLDNPLAIALPQELWWLMGISTASLVGTPLILAPKKQPEPTEEETSTSVRMAAAQEGVNEQTVKERLNNVGLVATNKKPRYARLKDLFQGDEVGNAYHVDVAKVQMFFFTIILVAAYVALLFDRLEAPATELLAAQAKFPALDASMVTLLGISHAGYLANKQVTHTRTRPSSS